MKKPFFLALLTLSFFLAAPSGIFATDTAEIEKYRQALRENPNDAKAYYRLGYLYESL